MPVKGFAKKQALLGNFVKIELVGEGLDPQDLEILYILGRGNNYECHRRFRKDNHWI